MLNVSTRKFLSTFQKKIYFLVVFCCAVGESGPVLMVRCGPTNGSKEKFGLRSKNEVLYQKLLCVLFYKKRRLNRFDWVATALKQMDLAKLFLFIKLHCVLKEFKCVFVRFTMELSITFK